MHRIDNRTVELTPEEMLIREIHDMLLDQGFDTQRATDMIFGCTTPIDLRTKTPTLDRLMTAEFMAYLRE